MKRAILILLLLGGLPACDRYPSDLTPSEQVQAIVFRHLASVAFQLPSAGDDASRIFLCYGEPKNDVSKAVQAYVARSFRSARAYSSAIPSDADGSYTERDTGRRGMLLHIKPFSTPPNGFLTIQVAYYVEDEHAAGFQYHLQRVNGHWTILDHQQLWVA